MTHNKKLEKLRAEIENCIDKKESVALSIFDNASLKEFYTVLRSFTYPYPIFYFKDILNSITDNLNTNENEEESSRENKTIRNIFNLILQNSNFTSLSNIIAAVDIINSLTNQKIKDLKLEQNLFELTQEVFKNRDTYSGSYYIADQLDPNELQFIKENKIAHQEVDNVWKLDFNSFPEFRDKVVESGELRFQLWHQKIDIQDVLFQRSLSLINNHFEDCDTGGDHITYSSIELLKFFFDFYKNDFKQKEKTSEKEKVHFLIWTLLNQSQTQSGWFNNDLFENNEQDSCALLQDYLLLDLKHHLDIFLTFNRQFEQKKLAVLGSTYTGRESFGGGISNSGDEFSLDDSYICEKILFPVLEALFEGFQPSHNSTELLDIIESLFLKLDEPITGFNPLFLKRAAIPTLVKLIGINKAIDDRLFVHLRTLVSISEGIPSCDESTLYYLYKRAQTDSLFISTYSLQTQNLIAQQMNNTLYHYPNIFSFKMLLLLTKEGNENAEKTVISLLKDNEFLKYDRYNYDIFRNTKTILGKKHPIVLRFLGVFANKPESIRGYGSGGSICEVLLENESEKGLIEDLKLLSIENDVKFKEILINTLGKKADISPIGALDALYAYLEGETIESLFPKEYDRIRICHILDKVADSYKENKEKVQKIHDIILEVLKQLSMDSSPEANDKYNEQVLNGEDPGFITTVRGLVCWSIMKFSIYHDFVADCWKLIKPLLVDKNNYVVQQALVCFLEIVKRRKWEELPTVEVEETLWGFIRNKDIHPVHEKWIIRILNYFRDRNTNEANEIIETFKQNPSISVSVIYFALYRKDHFKDSPVFDQKEAQRTLEELITNDNFIEHRKNILRSFIDIIKNDGDEWERIKSYINKIMLKNLIDSDSFSSLYQISKILIKNDSAMLKTSGINMLISLLKTQIKQNNFEVHYPHKLFKEFYGLAKKDFYNNLSLIVDLVRENNHDPLYSLSKIFNDEENATYLSIIKEIMNKKSQTSDEWFIWKERWLELKKDLLESS